MIFIFAVGWFVLQNAYFGWNAFPRSDAELISDGIGFLLLALWVIESKA